jgi:hypothetical protein
MIEELNQYENNHGGGGGGGGGSGGNPLPRFLARYHHLQPPAMSSRVSVESSTMSKLGGGPSNTFQEGILNKLRRYRAAGGFPRGGSRVPL